MESKSWVALTRASNQNYVVSFAAQPVSAQYPQHDTFKNMKQLMHYKSYKFTHPESRHEMMHCLNTCYDGDFKQYGAAALCNFTSDHKLVDRHKQKNMGKDGGGGDYFDFYGEDDHDDYYIDEEDVYQPPAKKRKVIDVPDAMATSSTATDTVGTVNTIKAVVTTIKEKKMEFETVKKPKEEYIAHKVLKSEDDTIVPKKEVIGGTVSELSGMDTAIVPKEEVISDELFHSAVSLP